MDYDVEVDQDKSPLTKTENPILRLVSLGFTRADIAEMLHRSIETVNTHISHIHQKLDAENSNQAITTAFVRGILKAKKLVLCCLITGTTGNAIIPSPAYADIYDTKIVEVPAERVRVGRNPNARSSRGRSQRRREDDLMALCFGDF